MTFFDVDTFDYCDTLYHNEDPLNYLISREFHDTLRQTFYFLNDVEQFIIKEIIIQQKSITHIALLLNMKEWEVKKKLESCLFVLNAIFKEDYYYLKN